MQCLKETGIHHIRLLYVLATIATVCFTPVWLLYDGLTISKDTGLVSTKLVPPSTWNACQCMYLQPNFANWHITALYIAN